MTLPLTVSDLHILDATPRIQDLKLAEALGFERPRKIRELVERNFTELERHGEVFSRRVQPGKTEADEGLPRGGANLDAGEKGLLHGAANPRQNRGGRPTTEYWLNEPQAILICMFSRTEKAADVRHLVVTVFMAWRREQSGGEVFATVARTQLKARPYEGRSLAERREDRRLCEAALVIHGPVAARQMWEDRGLPYIVQPDDEGAERLEQFGFDALRRILDAPIQGEQARAWLDRAIHLDPIARDTVRAHGMMVVEDEGGVVFANSAPFIKSAMSGNSLGSLKRLSGAKPWPVAKFGGTPSRGTFLPLATLDVEITDDE